jgi:hypothetical protein
MVNYGAVMMWTFAMDFSLKIPVTDTQQHLSSRTQLDVGVLHQASFHNLFHVPRMHVTHPLMPLFQV